MASIEWKRIAAPRRPAGIILAGAFLLAAIALGIFGIRHMVFDRPAPAYTPAQPAAGAVMLILRGIASADAPRGQLDDDSALAYARQLGYAGEVLDVAGNTGSDSPQVRMALERIRNDPAVKALYGFSGGGYNARRIWSELSPDERRRIERVVVLGAPGVGADDFAGSAEVVIKDDPPAGHMAGPKVLLEETRQRQARGPGSG